MKRLIAKINEVLKCLLTKNGQGLVEFVLILAFCAGIGIAAREAGFGQALNALFDSGEKPEYETAAIGGVRKIDWGKNLFQEIRVLLVKQMRLSVLRGIKNR